MECGMTHPVIKLRHEEAVCFDADRLESLCQEFGDIEAEQVIARALEQIAIKLAALKAYHAMGDATEMDKTCASLSVVAGQIGMTSLARVARDVRGCLKVGNAAAIGATLDRLLRIGDNSAHTIWSLDDISV